MDMTMPFPVASMYAKTGQNVQHRGQERIFERNPIVSWIARDSPICTKRTQLTVMSAASVIIG